MAGKTEILNTMELIRNFWPDFNLTKDDILSPTPAFVIRFYTAFLDEINDKLSYFINEEVGNEFDEIQEFDRVVYLYCRVSMIYKKMNYSTLYLGDFYSPHPKRIQTLLKLAIHFMIYVNNAVDEVGNVVGESLNALAEATELQNLKQQYLQENAEIAENLGRCENTHETLRLKLETVKKAHKKMLLDKAAKAEIYKERRSEVAILEHECDSLDDELKMLEETERGLQERVVTEEEFQVLKNTERYLKKEQEQLCSDDFGIDDGVDQEMKSVKALQDNAKELELLRFDSLNVEALHELRKEEQSGKKIQKKIKQEESSLGQVKVSNEDHVETLKERKGKLVRLCCEFNEKIAVDLERCRKDHESKVAENVAKFEEAQNLETELIGEEEEMRRIEGEEGVLNEAVAREYKRILDAGRTATNKFNNMLLNLNNQK